MFNMELLGKRVVSMSRRLWRLKESFKSTIRNECFVFLVLDAEFEISRFRTLTREQ